MQARLDRLEGQLDREGSSILGKWGKSAGLIAAAGIGAGIAGGGAFFAKAVMGASDLEETMSKVGVVFGDQTQIVKGFAEQMAKDFGLPKREILDAAASIGLVGKASGLSQGEAAGMSTQLARMAADAASFYNVPLPEALQAIQSGLVGEAEPMRRFGVLLNEAAVKEEAFALGIAKRGAELTEGQKVQARSSLIMKGMTDASGDLERTQGSLANRIRELKGRFENFATSVGTKVLPLVLKAFDFFEVLGPKIATFGKALASAFSGEGVKSDGAIGAFQQIGVVVREVIATVQENWPRIKEIVTEAMTTVQSVIAGVTTVIMTIWRNFGSQIVDVLKSAWDFVSDIVGAALQVIRGIIDVVTGIITGDWSRVWEGLQSIVAGAWDAIKAIVSTAIDLVKEILSAGWEIVKGIFTGAWDAIKTGVSEGIDAVLGFMRDLPGNIMSALGNLGSILYNAGKEIISGLWQGLKDKVGDMLDWVGGLAGKIADLKGPLDKDRKLLVPAGQAIIDGHVTGMRSHENNLVRQLKHTTGLVSNVHGSWSVAAPAASWSPSAPGIGGAGLVASPTDFDYDRLAAAMSRVQVTAHMDTGQASRALGDRQRAYGR